MLGTEQAMHAVRSTLLDYGSHVPYAASSSQTCIPQDGIAVAPRQDEGAGCQNSSSFHEFRDHASDFLRFF